MFRPLIVAASLLLLLFQVLPSAAAEPIVPGLVDSELAPEMRGRVLIEELNCVACHPSEASMAADSKKAPRLANVGSRVNPHYLADFLRAPHAIKPGTTMPDVLGALSQEERDAAAEALTHFLLSQKRNDFGLQAPDQVAAQHGERLFHSRGCVACHAPRDAEGRATEDAAFLKSSASLGALDRKYSFRSLVEFLRKPHQVRPSGRMPDLRLAGRELEQIAHYLLRNTKVPGSLEFTLYRGRVWEGLDSDEVAAERAGQVADFALESLGKVQHQTAIDYAGWLNVERAGAYRFFLGMNGGSLRIDGEEIAALEPSNRRGPQKVKAEAELATGWRRIELRYFHTGREPKFAFEMQVPGSERQPIVSAILSVSKLATKAFEPLQVEQALAERGRELFAEQRCANCHDDVEVAPENRPSALAFAQLKPGGGCLSETTGSWPEYHLGEEQRAWINAALPKVEKGKLDDRQRVDKTLVTFNCMACHDRAGLGGVDPQRLVHFSGTREALGNQGRVPPPLSHVGAKLTPQWIADVMLHGKRQRPYLDASMPQFGEANVGHLVELFGKVDTLEDVTIPEVANIKESKHAGYEMMGTKGFSCIACHDFNGSPAGGAGALDLVSVTERVQKNWFHLYMREPSRFHSTVIMPNYWPGGRSLRPEVLGGDAGQQIEALWKYLEDGQRAKKPAGLSRESNELRVFDVAEICRGRGTAGYRGIGVGYPEGVHLAFDSEEMALRLLWKGEFANVNHGSFQARGGERIAFPPGIPFHRLESMDDDWPYKGKTDYSFPQNLGYRFRGYQLDELRRPTFFYEYGDIEIADFFENVDGVGGGDGDGAAWFRRTIRFEAKGEQEPFYFRAAAGGKVAEKSEQEFQIDQLTIHLDPSHRGMVREGEPVEVLVPLTLPAGRSTLTLEYRW